jgi:hypothetical protein
MKATWREEDCGEKEEGRMTGRVVAKDNQSLVGRQPAWSRDHVASGAFRPAPI